MDKKYKVTVEVFGETCALKGDVEPERVLRIAALVDTRMREIAQANPRLSPSKVAVLAAMNIAGDYYQLEEDYQKLVKLTRREK